MKNLLVILALSSWAASAWGHFEEKVRSDARYEKILVATKKALAQKPTVLVVDTSSPKVVEVEKVRLQTRYLAPKIDTTIVLNSDSFRITGKGKHVSLAYYSVKDSLMQHGHVRGNKVPFSNVNHNVKFTNEGNELDLQYEVPKEEIKWKE